MQLNHMVWFNIQKDSQRNKEMAEVVVKKDPKLIVSAAFLPGRKSAKRTWFSFL